MIAFLFRFTNLNSFSSINIDLVKFTISLSFNIKTLLQSIAGFLRSVCIWFVSSLYLVEILSELDLNGIKILLSLYFRLY